MAEVTKYGVITPEGRVFVDNILKPDTPENRKYHHKFASGSYRVVLGFDKKLEEVKSWLGAHGPQLMKMLQNELGVSEHEARAFLLRRIKDGDQHVARVKHMIAIGKLPQDARVPTEYEGHWLIAAKSKSPPTALHPDGRQLTEEDCYRGMYGVADLTFFTYDTGEVRGLGAWLNGFVKTRDGDRLGGRARTTKALLDHVRTKVVVPVGPSSSEEAELSDDLAF